MQSVTAGTGTESAKCRQKRHISLGSSSRSRITQASRSIAAALRRVSAYLCIKSLSIIKSSYNQACRKNDVQEGRIVKSVRRVMIAHDTISNKDCILRRAQRWRSISASLVPYQGRSMGSNLVILCVFAALRRPFRLDN